MHPDKHNNNPYVINLFKHINEAYSTLTDKIKRTEYDEKSENSNSENLKKELDSCKKELEKFKKYKSELDSCKKEIEILKKNLNSEKSKYSEFYKILNKDYLKLKDDTKQIKKQLDKKYPPLKNCTCCNSEKHKTLRCGIKNVCDKDHNRLFSIIDLVNLNKDHPNIIKLYYCDKRIPHDSDFISFKNKIMRKVKSSDIKILLLDNEEITTAQQLSSLCRKDPKAKLFVEEVQINY